MKAFWIAALLLLPLLAAPARLPAESTGTDSPSPSPSPAGKTAAAPLSLAETVGLDLAGAYRAFGVPREVFPVRGEESWQDDVVFLFEDRLHLFWLRDRVWQVRLDRGFAGEFLGLRMGLPRAEVRSRLGEPLAEGAGDLLYHLEDVGWPIRLRLLFEEDRLVDAYCFRSDL